MVWKISALFGVLSNKATASNQSPNLCTTGINTSNQRNMKRNLFYLAWLCMLFCSQHISAQDTPDIVIEPFFWAMQETFYKPVDWYAREWGMTYLSSSQEPIYDGLYYVAQQNGIIMGKYVISDVGGYEWEIALDIQDRVYDTGNERGLLGMAFHPDFPDTPYVFVNYTGSGGTTYISRFTMELPSGPPANSCDICPPLGDPDSELIILTIDQPYSNHNGGDLHFGPDGYLYIGMGDGGSAGDPGNRAQNPQKLLGKMLRIDVSQATEEQPYTIPPDNPFADTTDGIRDEIWAFGLRNPWRFAFDQLTGDLWIADVGQDEWEEVDFEPANSGGGFNYGWRCYEGNHPYNTSNCDSMGTYAFPVFEYPHSSSNGCSITGGVVYRGCKYPNLYGSFLFTDYCSGKLWATRQDSLGNFITEELGDLPNFNFVSFAVNYRGNDLYLIGHDDGKIYQIKDLAASYELTVTKVPACPDEENGAIYLDFGNIPQPDVVWSTGDTSTNLTGVPSGFYEVNVTLPNGCTENYSFYIATRPTIDIELVYNNDTLFMTPANMLYPPYNWFFNGELIPDEHENFLIPQDTGYYQASATFSGCDYLSDSLLLTSVSSREINQQQRWKVFPNPFTSCFYLSPAGSEQGFAEELEINLVNQLGQVLWAKKETIRTSREFCLPESISPGMYLLRVRAKGQVTSIPMVKR